MAANFINSVTHLLIECPLIDLISKILVAKHDRLIALGIYFGFCRMKRLEVSLLPPGGDTSPSQGYTRSIRFAGTHLYTRVERGTVTVKCHVHTKQCTRLGLDPTRCRDQHTNHETTTPSFLWVIKLKSLARSHPKSMLLL